MKLNIKNIFFIFFLPLLVLGFFFLFYTPFWMTNDDVGMSMLAHGYGAFSKGSYFIQFSNIAWGFIVHNMPSILGTPGYSVATYLVLYFVGFVIFLLAFSLQPQENRYRKIILIILIIFFYSVAAVSPQFTINAGLLGVASILLIIGYSQNYNFYLILLAAAAFYFGFAIRSSELLFVFLVGLVFLPIGKLFKDKKFYITIMVAASLAIISTFIHDFAYGQEEWAAYNNLQNARLYWMDYAGFTTLSDSVREKNGYSKNDISLLSNWFFVDPSLHDPSRLELMRSAIDSAYIRPKNISDILIALKFLISPNLLLFTLMATSVFFVFPSKKLLISWLLALIGFAYLGYLGRPAIIRVYLPVLFLLTIVPLFLLPAKNQSRYKLPTFLILIIATLMTLIQLSTAYTKNQDNLRKAKTFADNSQKGGDLNFLNSIQYFAGWGADFPYEIAFPVLSTNRNSKYTIYGLASGTLNPYSVAQSREKSGGGFISDLKSESGLYLIAEDGQINMLRQYCIEHHSSTLEHSVVYNGNLVRVSKVRCP